MNNKFPALYSYITISSVIAILGIIIACLLGLIGALALPVNMITGFGILMIAIPLAFVCYFFLVFSELLKVFLEIETNTRKS